MRTWKSQSGGRHINSPQLRQLSGLGPASLLRSLGQSTWWRICRGLGRPADHLQGSVCNIAAHDRITMNDVIHSWRHRTCAGLRYLLFRKWLPRHRRPAMRRVFRTVRLFPTNPTSSSISITFSAADAAGARSATRFRLHRVGVSIGCRPDARLVRIQIGRPIHAAAAIQTAYLSSRSDRDKKTKQRRRRMNVSGNHAAAGNTPLHRRRARARCPLHSDRSSWAFRARDGHHVFHPTSTCRMGCDPRLRVDDRAACRGH